MLGPKRTQAEHAAVFGSSAVCFLSDAAFEIPHEALC